MKELGLTNYDIKLIAFACKITSAEMMNDIEYVTEEEKEDFVTDVANLKKLFSRFNNLLSEEERISSIESSSGIIN